MTLADGVCFVCCAAGITLIIFGICIAGEENALRKATKEALERALGNLVPDSRGAAAGLAIVSNSKHCLTGPAEFTKALGEFARGMHGLTRTVQVFLIAALMFFIAGAVSATVAFS